MRNLPLGPTSLQVSRLAYGCWRIAPTGDSTQDLAIARAALSAALEAGYTFFDHADIYCAGRAEDVFGRLLPELGVPRESLVLASKCGIRLAKDPLPDAPYRYDSSADYIVRQCEGSLRRLGTEYLDVYQIHRPDWLMDAAEMAQAFEKLHRSGKVRHFGVSNFSPSQVELLQSAWNQPLVVNQVEISLCQLNAFTDGTLDQCQQRKMAPLAWSPLAGGVLADGPVEILGHQRVYQAEALHRALDETASAHGTTREVAAVAWLLNPPAGIIPIIGSTKPERIRALAKAPEVLLTREQWYRLLTVARPTPLP